MKNIKLLLTLTSLPCLVFTFAQVLIPAGKPEAKPDGREWLDSMDTLFPAENPRLH